MKATIVVGAQFGSEGKGKAVYQISKSKHYAAYIRCGGPNSGHNTEVDGVPVTLRQLPAGAADNQALLCISAGSAIDPDVLRREIELLEIPRIE